MSPDPAADKLNDQFEATVVVPALNAEGTLGVTLQAIDQQSIRDRLRVIVVDNGSTDSTVSIAEAFADHVVIEPAQGIAHARNAGLIVCRTPWMLTTDADTRPQRDWAAQHLRHLVQCAPDVIATAGRIIPFPSSSWWAQREDVTPHPSVRAGRLQYAVTVNAAFRAKSVRELGGFPSYFADDAAFGEVARGAGYRFVSLPGAVVEHRNPGNRTSTTGRCGRLGATPPSSRAPRLTACASQRAGDGGRSKPLVTSSPAGRDTVLLSASRRSA